MRHSKSRVSKEINWKIYRLKGLAAQLRTEANSNGLLPGHTKLLMAEVSRQINTLTSKDNARLKNYRKHCYNEGRVL